MEEQTKDLSDYLVVLRRRKKQVLSTIGILFIVTLLVAFLLPPVYRSSATILIEEQEIPQDLVRSTITSYADQRIQVISQRVMTRANLMQIVEKYNLYPTDRKRKTTEELLEDMRKDIKLNLINANANDQRKGAAIAFTVSYEGETADSAQKVANELTSLYLNENLKNREQKTAETSAFLGEEAERLKKQIAESEAKLAVFKAKNMDSLPQLTQLNMSMRDRTDTEIREVDRQISSGEERKIYLESQLVQINPYTTPGEKYLNPDDRLKMLQSSYASMSGVYAPNHPDLVKMRREIEGLKKETGATTDLQDQLKKLSAMQGELASMREKYSEDHPDVVKFKKAVASLEESVKTKKTGSADTVTRKAENPAYISLQAQLDALRVEMKSLRVKREQLKAKLDSYETMLRQSPQVEREYLDLARDHENSVRRYQELKNKQMQAEVAQELEKGSKGERFSLIEPAQFPEKPSSPNRPAIVLIGLALSVGGGIGYANVMSGLGNSVSGSKALAGLIQAPLLGIVPYIENEADKKSRRRIRNVLAVSLVGGLVLIVLLIHFFWTPLDVLWYRILRVLEMYLPQASQKAS